MAKNLNINEIKDLIHYSVKGTVPTDFSTSVSEINEVIKSEIRALASDFNAYRRNKNDIFEIIQEGLDLTLPKKIADTVGQFAEVREFRDGEKVQFNVRKGKSRGKRFVTRAAESGVYRAFRLDTDYIDVNTYTLGNAGYIDFARWMRGEEDISEIADIVMESFEDALYEDILKALQATINSNKMPTANKYAGNGFDAEQFGKLCNIAKTYGEGAVIFATPEFVATMDTANSVGTGIYPNISANDVEDIRTKGYIGMFRGCPIVQIPNSFTDETNTELAINPSTAYIFPTGGEKIVKVALEGQTVAKDFQNRDNSMEIQAYKNVGIAIVSYHNWCIYQNKDLD